MKTYTQCFKSVIGPITIVADDDSLKELNFGPPKRGFKETPNKITKTTISQLNKYFAGKLKKFDLPLSPEGTEFQKRAWKALSSIQYGKTASYSEQAKKMGLLKGFRAVGAANGKNPIPVIVPCHRVIGKNGKLTGYTGGLDIKSKLLEIERADI